MQEVAQGAAEGAAAVSAGRAPRVRRPRQYIVLRADLDWPRGALAAQAVHAALKCVELHRDEAGTQDYLSDLDGMHTVVLSCPDRAGLVALAGRLLERGVACELWKEQPEDEETALAVVPCVGKTLEKARAVLRGLELFG